MALQPPVTTLRSQSLTSYFKLVASPWSLVCLPNGQETRLQDRIQCSRFKCASSYTRENGNGPTLLFNCRFYDYPVYITTLFSRLKLFSEFDISIWKVFGRVTNPAASPYEADHFFDLFTMELPYILKTFFAGIWGVRGADLSSSSKLYMPSLRAFQRSVSHDV